MSGAPTRWEVSANASYGPTFDRLVREGADVHGEARLADALLPRGGTVLDAGSGMGRVAAELAARGHRVTAVEKDRELVEQSRATYPDLPVLVADLADLTPRTLAEQGAPTAYDLVVAVGNVLVYLAEGTERIVLGNLAALLAEGGRVLVGFHPEEGPQGARGYDPVEFVADVEASGLEVVHRFGTYDLAPPAEDYCVWVLSARARAAGPAPTA